MNEIPQQIQVSLKVKTKCIIIEFLNYFFEFRFLI